MAEQNLSMFNCSNYQSMSENIMCLVPNETKLNAEIPHSFSTIYIATTFLIFMCLQGTIGNSIIVVCVIHQKSLREMTHILAANYCFVGLIFSMVIIPVNIYSIIHTGNIDGVLCHAQGYLHYALNLADQFNCIAIAFIRYVQITKPRWQICNKLQQTIKLCVVFLYFVPLTLAVMSIPFIRYNPKILECFLVIQETLYLFILVFFPPICTIITVFVLYLVIFKHVYDSQRKVAGFQTRKSKDNTKSLEDFTKNISVINDRAIPLIKIDCVSTSHVSKSNNNNNISSQQQLFPLNNIINHDSYLFTSHQHASNVLFSEGLPNFEKNTECDSKPKLNVMSSKRKFSKMAESYNQQTGSLLNKTGEIDMNFTTYIDAETNNDVIYKSTEKAIQQNSNSQPCHSNSQPCHSNSQPSHSNSQPAHGNSKLGHGNSQPGQSSGYKLEWTISNMSDNWNQQIDQSVDTSISETTTNTGNNTKTQWKPKHMEIIKNKRKKELKAKTVRCCKSDKPIVYLFLVFMVFCVMYLPVTIIQVLDQYYFISPDLWLMCHTLSLSYSTIIWILYGILNGDFRKYISSFFSNV